MCPCPPGQSLPLQVGRPMGRACQPHSCLLVARLYSGSVPADSTMLNVALLHKWGRFSRVFLHTISPEGTVAFEGSVSGPFEGRGGLRLKIQVLGG